MDQERPDPDADAPPTKTTRRRVLQVAGGVLASGALAAGGFTLYDRRQRFGREALREIPDHRVQLPPTAPRMVIVRGGDPAHNVRAAIERLGGISRFVTPQDVVLVKPNVGWSATPDQGANTHPAVVAELVRLCRTARAKRVLVSDCPVSVGARVAFLRSGILRAALVAGAEVLPPEDSRYHTVKISERLGTWDVLEPFVVATKIINVPVVKHHTETLVSGGMKNWIGITTSRRVVFHNDIQRSIAELAALMRPTLTVLDATRVLMDHGPQGGNRDDVKQVNTVVAGVDPVALDAWAFAQLEIPIDKLPACLRIGESMGLGRVDYRALQPVEITAG